MLEMAKKFIDILVLLYISISVQYSSNITVPILLNKKLNPSPLTVLCPIAISISIAV